MKIRHSFYNVIDLIFPSKCLICKKNISYNDNLVCSGCLDTFQKIGETCSICSSDLVGGECRFCSERYLYFDRNLSLYIYDGAIVTLFYKYKFGAKRRLSRFFSALCFAGISDFADAFDLVTPVPSTSRKVRKRGYNQSSIIAKDLAKLLRVKYADLLTVTDGGVQKKLPKKMRFLNVLGRYRFRGGVSVIGKRILLIDDVFTTGATTNECSRILKKNGCATVFSLTIARVDINE